MTEQGQPQINKGTFNFLAHNGCDIHEMRRILTVYANELGLKKPKQARREWYSTISEKTQEDFKSFKKCFNANKSKRRKQQSYEEWYEEASQDGSLAFNGVADSF